MARPALLAVALGLLSALGVDPAAAATVRLVHDPVSGDTAVTFAAAPGETNEVAISGPASRWNVQDLVGNRITAVPPCSPASAGVGTAAACPPEGVGLISADLGDGHDSISLATGFRGIVTGGDGRDRFFGGQGNDSLEGGAGDDRIDGWEGADELVGGPGSDLLIGSGGGDVIDARDGGRDEVDCGPGPDRVRADAVDALDASCEQILETGQLPSAVTVIAAEVRPTSARLVAVVNPRGSATKVHFELGTSPSYTAKTPSIEIGSGVDDVVVSIVVDDLRPAAMYHFRVVATSVEGTANGRDATFVTAAQPRRPVCRVPDLRRRSLRAARAMLATSGCRLGVVQHVRSRARRGTVVAQRPRVGTRLRAGARVGVAVSRG
jgi:RTX calcium-binding nonapeptide repeat (4 copies)/PASTA domain